MERQSGDAVPRPKKDVIVNEFYGPRLQDLKDDAGKDCDE
jgi:hypothetical protein